MVLLWLSHHQQCLDFRESNKVKKLSTSVKKQNIDKNLKVQINRTFSTNSWWNKYNRQHFVCIFFVEWSIWVMSFTHHPFVFVVPTYSTYFVIRMHLYYFWYNLQYNLFMNKHYPCQIYSTIYNLYISGKQKDIPESSGGLWELKMRKLTNYVKNICWVVWKWDE